MPLILLFPIKNLHFLKMFLGGANLHLFTVDYIKSLYYWLRWGSNSFVKAPFLSEIYIFPFSKDINYLVEKGDDAIEMALILAWIHIDLKL